MRHTKFTCLGLMFLSQVAWGDAVILDQSMDALRDGYYSHAAQLLAPLARDGDPRAQFGLGLLYHSGSGVVRDEEMALWLYHEAAKAGSPLAQEYLIVGYQEGWFGLRKDLKKATYWRKQLARSER